MNTGAVAMHGDVQMALNDKSVQVVDARSAGRFAAASRAASGTAFRPYAGRVQCALYRNRRERPPCVAERIAAAFKKAGGRYRQTGDHQLRFRRYLPAILTLGLDAARQEAGRIYDGSWAEWGSRPDLIVVKD